MKDLTGCVCLVTGATRGIGKGIAISLGKSGATVYLTGRTSVPLNGGVGGSLQETYSFSIVLNNRYYFQKAIPVMVDHSNENEIGNLFHQIDREQKGRLDIVVNNAYSAVTFLQKNMGKPYYEITGISPGEAWDVVNDTGLKNHYICSVLATRMMIEYQKKTNPSSARPGLIVNITSIGGKIYLFNVSYGSGKAALDRMTHDMAYELRRENVNISIVGISPGLVRTEHILDAASKGSLTMNIENSESPELVGRVVVGMAAESPKKLLSRSGHIFLVSDLAEEYGIHEDCGREIKCIPVAVDHTDDDQISKLFDRIEREQHGRLDILVNNAYSAVGFLLNNVDKPYYEIESKSPGEAWDIVNNVGLRNNYICSVFATKMMINYQEKLKRDGVKDDHLRPGLIVNVSSIGAKIYFFNAIYGAGKAALDRMTCDMAYDLKRTNTNICIFSLWPGPVRTETVVAESTDGTLKLGEQIAFHYDTAESPQLSGKVIIAIANEQRDKLLSRNGQVILTCDIADEYSIKEMDGRKPINLRSLQLAVKTQCSLLAYFIPGFIRIPLSLSDNIDASYFSPGQRPHSVEIMGTLDLDESFIDPFLELAPFSARSEKTYDEGRPKVEHRQIIGNLPIPIDNLKAHLPFLATHLQEALAESVSTGNPNQVSH
ncbi:unnamed protein product [Schistosoma margrebowiei]|uniref:Uncharacterized protein n=1 Tax=Schistosoma margrebowiei TaxID=48269 RepID=A0A183LB25_9TREM|nr:unnamed protein product [Schistosoma margrebowiei]